MASFKEQFDLAQSWDWRARVMIAMCKVATAVVGEAQTGTTPWARWNKRHDLGVAILNDPDRYVARFCVAIASLNTVFADSSDLALEGALISVYPDIAGVKVND